MTQLTHQIEFKALREAYNEVKNFIEKETLGEVPSIHTKIENDLGYAGDDSYELIEKFIIKYSLNTSGLDLSKHFLSEGELFNSEAVLLGILYLPVFLTIWLVKMVTFGKVDFTKKQIFPEYYRETIDMTFGDMLSWYLTGSYNLRKNVSVVLQ